MPRPEAFINGSLNKALATAIWDRALTFTIHPYDVLRRGLYNGLAPLPEFPRNELRKLILANAFVSTEKPYLGGGSPEEFSRALGVGSWKMDEITYVEHFYMAAFTTCFFSEHLSTAGTLLWDVIGGPLAALVFRDTWESKWAKIKHDLTQAVTCNAEGTNYGKQFWTLLQNEWSMKIVEDMMGKNDGTTPPGSVVPPTLPVPPPSTTTPPSNGAAILGNHPVVAGDWLSKIAGKWYNGEVLLWPVIFDANRAIIGSNPNVVKVGQVLKIPSIAGYTKAQLEEFRVRGRNWRNY
jgi:LysM repeat protein